MRFVVLSASLLALLCPSMKGFAQGFQDDLLDHFVGSWLMEGTIAGEEAHHDIVAEWVLQHQYLQFHELSREKEESGVPRYEAIVTIGWDEASGRYVCQWLDSTGGGGLVPDGFGYAERSGNEIPFVFGMGAAVTFHTTFSYHPESDTWDWSMDAEEDGEWRPFARVRLSRQ